MSNYGPKMAELYSQEDNARRKSSRTGEEMDWDTNPGIRNVSTKPGQLSRGQQVTREHEKYQRLNKKQPVRSFRKELQAQGKSELEITQILNGLVKVG